MRPKRRPKKATKAAAGTIVVHKVPKLPVAKHRAEAWSATNTPYFDAPKAKVGAPLRSNQHRRHAAQSAFGLKAIC